LERRGEKRVKGREEKGVGRKGEAEGEGGRVASWLLGGWTLLGRKTGKISPFNPPVKNRGGLY